MDKNKESILILMADDDDDDYLLTKKALKKSKLLNDLYRVKDGEELLDYLRQEGDYKDTEVRRPGLILLDLNMPRKDGREALSEIKQDKRFADIPVVVFTTSKAEEDVYKTYQLGVNSFITKPVTFDSLIQVMQALGTYWFEVVELPSHTKGMQP
jgi:CheY-like chemotaxis protein